jgi:transcriptional regulator with XRE-family HTH domain
MDDLFNTIRVVRQGLHDTYRGFAFDTHSVHNLCMSDPVKMVDAVAVKCGRRLREARDTLGLTRKELAKETGIKATAIGNYELGIRRLGHEEAEALAKFFGTPSAYWLGVASESEARVLASIRNNDGGTITGHYSRAAITKAFEKMGESSRKRKRK